MIKRICTLLTCAMCLFAVPVLALEDAYEGPGAMTAQEAVIAYLNAAKTMDLPGMLRAFAIESYVEHFDLSGQLVRLGGYTPSLEIRLPNTNEFYRALNVEARKGAITNSISRQFMAFNLPWLDLSSMTVLGGDDIEAFLLKLSDSRLAIETRAFEDFVDPAQLSDIYAMEQNQKNLRVQASIAGAEELHSMAATCSAMGKSYLFCCDVLRYGERWYLASLSGNIGALLAIPAASGGMMPFE